MNTIRRHYLLIFFILLIILPLLLTPSFLSAGLAFSDENPDMGNRQIHKRFPPLDLNATNVVPGNELDSPPPTSAAAQNVEFVGQISTKDKLTIAPYATELSYDARSASEPDMILSFYESIDIDPADTHYIEQGAWHSSREITLGIDGTNNPQIDLINQFEKTIDSYLYLPLISKPPDPPSWINTQDKETVRQFYLIDYLSSDDIDSQWTGDHASCDPGTTSAEFKTAMLRRINYFRSMSGIPSIVGFKDEYNRKAQAAALMMSVNRQLDHTPTDTWKCFSDDGYEGASSSNLGLGAYGPSIISGYIYDGGDSNYFVGHRRWILYPQTQYMGTGDIPPQNGYLPSNALWVFDDDIKWGERTPTREPFVAWPPPGYVPRQVVYPRWSFAYPNADFTNSTVNMTRDGTPVNVTINPIVEGYGQNTLVWELDHSIPDMDIIYTVTIHNVINNSIAQNFTYQVKIFDPSS